MAQAWKSAQKGSPLRKKWIWNTTNLVFIYKFYHGTKMGILLWNEEENLAPHPMPHTSKKGLWITNEKPLCI
jgi:hypothetical protein